MNRFKALFSLAVIVLAVYLGYKLLPPYFANYQFQDSLDTEVRFNVYNQRSEAEIKDMVIKKAAQNDIALVPENIKITRTGGAGGIATSVSIAADYTVHVDLPLHPLDIHFTPHSKDISRF